MRIVFLILFLVATFGVRADWLVALQAYENKKYSAAKVGFENLLPLGNADAAFNLAVMAYYGEGQEVNLEEALSHFLLAEKLQHPQATEIVKRIYQEASAAQRVAAEDAASKAFSAVIIKQDAKAYQLSREHAPAQISTPMPDIPDDVSRKNPFGYIVLQFLVDGSGRVQVVDAIDGFPEGVFDSYTFRAMRRWQYEATGKPHLLSVKLNFWVKGAMNGRSANQVLSHQNLWQYAQIGSGRHQEMLGSVLNLVSMVSGALVYVEPSLSEPQSAPDLSAWFETKKLEVNISSLEGSVSVQTNEQGEIVRLLDISSLYKPEPEKILGLKVRGAAAGIFELTKNISQDRSFSRISKRDGIIIQQYLPVHAMLTPGFWWKKAAVNGDRRAQRILGAQREDWQFYLLQQQDPMAMAWHGARLILDGERTEGVTLLEQAKTAGYKPAADLIEVLAQ
ncbi:hypothetical protein GCM10010919_30540 [Alishewanella longhuensis]|uniref:TonB C-terminal domain-containing protein n=1 Tax=Alishewanella longhuensis TaxID=1091037 RepID=A0ABQ3L1L7_9ALTE|nr:hypothetical protein [Alishewanella longhuensis]GHG75890.1 hypothetical protein GCM10010919_30540 [Alishewanella longhuensis]